ncbi:hypothetical protein [Ascidiimonas aurantiaca]|uniref:hypothetical protein n=1 Tax=Ascidiimonas aurantiaca TaxID=1685432 RepID=UPI0030ED2BA7
MIKKLLQTQNTILLSKTEQKIISGGFDDSCPNIPCDSQADCQSVNGFCVIAAGLCIYRCAG